jgi:hypothetical protein
MFAGDLSTAKSGQTIKLTELRDER